MKKLRPKITIPLILTAIFWSITMNAVINRETAGNWTSAHKQQLTDQCQQRASNYAVNVDDFCSCVVDQVVNTYSFTQANDIAKQYKPSDPNNPLAQIGQACATQGHE